MFTKIFLVCALYSEAKPLIRHLQLKPGRAPSGLQIFENEHYTLVITGTGKVASAVGTTFGIANSKSVIRACANVGMCGARDQKIGALFLIDQVIDEANSRTFYPDVFRKTDIPRNILHTVDQPYQSKEESWEWAEGVVDMEGSGFYEAASNFLSADKIQLLKIVSDNADQSKLDPKKVDEIMTENIPKILEYLQSFPDDVSNVRFTQEEQKALDELFARVHFTVTERRRCEGMVGDLKVQRGNLQNFFEQIKSKASGKEVLNFAQQLLQSC